MTVHLHTGRLDSGNALEIFEPYDLILDGTDNFATRYLVNDAGVLLGKPYVWGSIYRFEGQASVFWAEPTARAAVPRPLPGAAAARAWCRPAPRVACSGVLCASIGSIMVTEAIKLITGIGETAAGPADGLRRAGDDLPHGQDPQGPGAASRSPG